MYCKWFPGFFLASNLSHGARHGWKFSTQTSKDKIRECKPILFLFIRVSEMELGSLCLLLVNFSNNKIYINPTTFLTFEVFMVVCIKLWFCGIWNHALWYIGTNILEEPVVFISHPESHFSTGGQNTMAAVQLYSMVHNLQNVGMGSPVISGSLPPEHGTSSGCRWRNGLQRGG